MINLNQSYLIRNNQINQIGQIYVSSHSDVLLNVRNNPSLPKYKRRKWALEQGEGELFSEWDKEKRRKRVELSVMSLVIYLLSQ